MSSLISSSFSCTVLFFVSLPRLLKIKSKVSAILIIGSSSAAIALLNASVLEVPVLPRFTVPVSLNCAKVASELLANCPFLSRYKVFPVFGSISDVNPLFTRVNFARARTFFLISTISRTKFLKPEISSLFLTLFIVSLSAFLSRSNFARASLTRPADSIFSRPRFLNKSPKSFPSRPSKNACRRPVVPFIAMAYSFAISDLADADAKAPPISPFPSLAAAAAASAAFLYADGLSLDFLFFETSLMILSKTPFGAFGNSLFKVSCNFFGSISIYLYLLRCISNIFIFSFCSFTMSCSMVI